MTTNQLLIIALIILEQKSGNSVESMAWVQTQNDGFGGPQLFNFKFANSICQRLLGLFPF